MKSHYLWKKFRKIPDLRALFIPKQWIKTKLLLLTIWNGFCEDNPMTIRIAMVCMGNICRSPMAEHVLRGKAKAAGLDVEVVSGGTGGWHAGEAAHPRTQKVLSDNGFTSNHTAKQITSSWFDDFDYLVVMDKTNLSDIKEFARNESDLEKVSLLRDYDPNSPDGSEVPDPYYSDYSAYLDVFEMVNAACDGLVEFLKTK